MDDSRSSLSFRGSNLITINNLLTLFIGLYFMFSSLDYVAKISTSSSSAPSFLRIFGIGIYLFGAINIFTFKFRYNKMQIVLLYLMVLSYVSILWSIAPNSGSGAFSVTTTILVVFLSLDANFSKNNLRFLEFMIVLGAIVAFFYQIIVNGTDFNDYGNRLYFGSSKGTHSDPNGMAARLVMPIVVAVKNFFERKKILYKVFYGVSVFPIIYLLLLCGSRGAIIGVLAALFIFVLKLPTGKKIRYIIIGALLLFVLLYYAKDLLPSDIYNRIFSVDSYSSNGEIDSNGRLEIWKIFFEKCYFDSPFIGFGVEGLSYKIGPYFGHEYSGVHNTYFQVLGDYGILGIFAFLYFIILVRKKIKNNGNAFMFWLFYAIIFVACFLGAYNSKFLWNMFLYVIIYCNVRKKINLKYNVKVQWDNLNERY